MTWSRRAKDPWTHVDQGDGTGCWVWRGTVDRNGYGLWWDREHHRYKRAHRAVYEKVIGPIPDDLPLDHECHNLDPTCDAKGDCPHRRCVRPGEGHCTPKSQRENLLAGRTIAAHHAAQTHCHNGHELDERNTYVTPAGKRHCRACTNANARRYKAARRTGS